PRTSCPKVIHTCGQPGIRSLDPHVDETIDSRIHSESMICSEALEGEAAGRRWSRAMSARERFR
ncbi:MAG: hypothetical protein ACREQJ_09240, partial [Candidatus Binatia bacterium]